MASELAEVLPLDEFGMQICRKCGQELSLKDFPALASMRLGVRKICKKCYSSHSRDWTVKNPDRSFDGHLRRSFGITLADYNAMLEQQGGVCAICGGGPTARSNRRRGGGKVFIPRLVVDHDHASGKVRGLLCSTCNTGIGGLKDDAALVRRALEYLERA